MENEKNTDEDVWVVLFKLFAVIIGPFIVLGIIFSFIGNSSTSQNPSSERASTQYFYGYKCTDDCSGHQAGYDWARDKGITDPDDCGGNSRSFINGCKAWAKSAW